MLGLLELRRVIIFENLDDRELGLVSSIVEYRRCPADTVVVEAGSSDRSLFIVYAGSVRIAKHDSTGVESPIAEVLPGQHLGEVTFVNGGERTATATTNEPTELLVIDPLQFRRLADAHPAIAYKIGWSLLAVLCTRLRNTDFMLFEFMNAGVAGSSVEEPAHAVVAS